MKKFYLAVATLAISTVALAQPREPRERLSPMKPEAGDYGLQIDATPVLDYFGKLLSNAGATAPTWDFTNPSMTIVGKYFADENTAYRGLIRIGVGSTTRTENTPEANATAPTFPTLPSTVEDKMKQNYNFVGIGVGLEKRRGKGRLFGIYGADFMVFTTGSSTKYIYGNALNPSTVAGQTVLATASHDFGSNINGVDSRVLSSKSGQAMGLSLRAFAGVEFFVASKISLGAEFGWGLAFSTSGVGKVVTEEIGGTPSATSLGTVAEVERVGGKTSRIGVDTDNSNFGQGFNGALRLNFYF